MNHKILISVKLISLTNLKYNKNLELFMLVINFNRYINLEVQPETVCKFYLICYKDIIM